MENRHPGSTTVTFGKKTGDKGFHVRNPNLGNRDFPMGERGRRDNRGRAGFGWESQGNRQLGTKPEGTISHLNAHPRVGTLPNDFKLILRGLKNRKE